MNGRKAKSIRKLAEGFAYLHYLSLLDEEQQEQLTVEMALEYTPYVNYVYVETGSYRKPGAKRVQVSENTLRWFIKQGKKDNDNRYRLL